MKREDSEALASKPLPPETSDEEKLRIEGARLAKLMNLSVKGILAGALILIGVGLGWYGHPGIGLAVVGGLIWFDLFHWSLEQSKLKKNPGRKSG